MTDETFKFKNEIEKNKSAETVSDESVRIDGEHSSLEVRARGCFITDCELANPLSGKKMRILYSNPNHSTAKLTASHMMSPIGSSEDIGGQHGFPRWADYHKFTQSDGENGERRVSFQAKRSDTGMGIVKAFELGESYITSETTVSNYEPETIDTSLGEHLYFRLEDEETDGLLVDGQTIDELLGEGSLKSIIKGEASYWASFDRQVIVDFPDGHSIRIGVSVSGAEQDLVGMLIWHRPGTESICFEPTVGFDPEMGKGGIQIKQHETATLSTIIELLTS